MVANVSPQFLKQFVQYGFLLGLAWMSLWTLISAVYRKRKGNRIFSPSFSGARFLEQWTTGWSHNRGILGTAKNCLLVGVTEDQLLIAPHFPFNLWFMPEIFDLEHRINGSSIIDVQDESTRSTVVVRFNSPTGSVDAFELKLRDREAFRAAIATIRKPGK
jgi:hypothetical protein